MMLYQRLEPIEPSEKASFLLEGFIGQHLILKRFKIYFLYLESFLFFVNKTENNTSKKSIVIL